MKNRRIGRGSWFSFDGILEGLCGIKYKDKKIRKKINILGDQKRKKKNEQGKMEEKWGKMGEKWEEKWRNNRGIMKGVILIWVIFLWGCERKVGVIKGEGVGYEGFIEILKGDRVDLRGRKLEELRKKLLDWKKLRQELENYMDWESMWEELKEKGFDKGREDQKRMHGLMELGRVRGRGKELELRIKKIIREEGLDNFLEGKGSLGLGGGFWVDYGRFWELYREDIVRGLEEGFEEGSGGRREERMEERMKKGIIVNILRGRELEKGGRVGLGNKWIEGEGMRWKWRLIGMYQRKVEEEYKEEVMGEEGILREYYRKNQSQYQYEKVVEGGMRQKYQLSYSRVKSDLVGEFVDRRMGEWKKRLWAKHGMGIEEEYFKGLGAREVELERRAKIKR